MTFSALYFAVMIAIAVGVGMPTRVKYALNPAPREPRIIAFIWVALAGIIFFLLSGGDEVLASALTGVALGGLLVRFLAPYAWKHVQCSHAIEEIRLLPTMEERKVYYARLSEDIQAMVDKRTPRPDLWKAPAQPTLLANCANPGGPAPDLWTPTRNFQPYDRTGRLL